MDSARVIVGQDCEWAEDVRIATFCGGGGGGGTEIELVWLAGQRGDKTEGGRGFFLVKAGK
jgi:hypothetical protein